MKSEIKSGMIIGYINTFATLFIGLLYTPLMLRLMGQSEFGLYSLVSSTVAYLSILDMGYGNATVRYISKAQAHSNKKEESKLNGLFLMIYIAIGILTLIIGYFLKININNLFGTSLNELELREAKIIIDILIGTIAISFPLSIFDSYVIASEKFNFLKILNIVKTLSIPIVTIPLLCMGYKSISVIIITSFFNILYHICTMIYDFKKLSMKIEYKLKKEDFILLKEIFAYSFFVFLNLIVDVIFNNTDQIILGSVCGTIAVSIYSVAAKISQMNTTFSTTISSLFLPRITKLTEEENSEKKVSNLFIKVSRIQLYIMMLILSGFIIFGQKFISIWAGADYYEAYYIILLLIAPGIIPLTQNICISIIQAKNKHQFRSIVYIIIAILNVLISIPLARKYGGIGAAIGTTLSNLLGQIIIMNIYYYKVMHIDIPLYWKHFLKFSIPVIAFSIVMFFINNNITVTLFVYLIEILLYIFIYSLYSFSFMNSVEKKYIKGFFTKIFKKIK